MTQPWEWDLRGPTYYFKVTDWYWTEREAVLLALKSVPGHHWDSANRVWQIPRSQMLTLAHLIAENSPDLAEELRTLASLRKTQVQAIHKALRQVAGDCDGAFEKDGVGFNKSDATRGKILAHKAELDAHDTLAALPMVRRYHRQIDPETLREALCQPKE